MCSRKTSILLLISLLVLCLFWGAIAPGNPQVQTSTGINHGPEAPAVVSSEADYEYYFNKTLDMFNMTIESYTELLPSDKEIIHKYVNALWGFENESLTRAEAEDMIRPNSPETYFGPVELIGYFDFLNLFQWFTEKPSPVNIPKHTDAEGFEINFVSRAVVGERITRVNVKLVTDAGSMHLALAEEHQPVDTGYISGTSWFAYDWVDILGQPHTGMCAHWPFLSDHCYFKAWGNPGCVDSSVTVLINYEYEWLNPFHLYGYILGIPFYGPCWELKNHLEPIDSYAVLNQPIGIQDDDANAPIIGSIDIPEHDGFPWEAPWVYDDTEVLTISGTVYEGNYLWFQKNSGISAVNVSIGGHIFEYIAKSEYVTVNNYGDYVYSYNVTLLNPGYWLGVGQHTAIITITDGDNDRDGDMKTSAPMSINFEIKDDDDEAPFLGVNIDDPIYSDDTVILPFTVFAYDSSGISSVLIKVGPHTLYSTGYHEVELPMGSYTFDVWVTDADNDGPNDGMTAEYHSEGELSRIEISGVLGDSSWYLSSVFVTLKYDDSGETDVASVYYILDSGSETLYTGTFEVSGIGEHSIEFWSVDDLGNIESPTNTYSFRIDTTKPSTGCTTSGEQGLGDFYLSDVTVTLSHTDTGSGVTETWYSLDGVNWNLYSIPFDVSFKGETEVRYYSIDLAGNVEGTKVEVVKIDDDITGPMIEISYTGDATDGSPGFWTISVFDPESGIGSIFVRIDGVLVGISAGEYAVPNSLGTHVVNVIATNADLDWGSLDQESSTAEAAATITDDDTTPPEITIVGPEPMLPFEEVYGNLFNPAIQTFTIPDMGVTSCRMEITCYCSADDWAGINAIQFRLDGIGGWIGTYYTGFGQMEGNVISPGQTLTFIYDMSHVMFADSSPAGYYYQNFIPLSPSDLVGFLSPGVHTLEAWVSSQEAGAPESWVTIKLYFNGIETYENPGVWTVSAFDSQSGVESYVVEIDGVVVGDSAGEYPIPSSIGTHSITVTAYDADLDRGLPDRESSTVFATATVTDLMAPTTTILIGSPFVDPYLTSATSLELISDDGFGVGVDKIYYKINDGSWFVYDVPFVLTGEDGEYTVHYYAMDLYGNTEYENSMTFILDNSSPVTTYQAGIPVAGNHITSSTPLDLSADDDTGVGIASIHYKVNAGPWQTYDTSFFLVGGDGDYTISYFAVDNLGNVATELSAVFILDNSAPTTTIVVGTPEHNSYLTSDTPLGLDAIDTGSDVHTSYYRINDGTWNVYSSEFTLMGPDGVYWIEYFSSDTLGNTEATHSVSYQLDNTAPVSHIELSGDLGGSNWYVSSVFVTLTFEDGTETGSGVAMTAYRYEGIPWTEYTGPFTLSLEGITTLEFNSTDLVGNIETTQSQIIRIDTIAPETSMWPGGSNFGLPDENGVEWTKGPFTFYYQCFQNPDASSGLYEVDASVWPPLWSVAYKIDDGPWQYLTLYHLYPELHPMPAWYVAAQLWGTPVWTFTTEGVHTFYWYATDLAGNVEETHEWTFGIDNTPPEVELIPEGTEGQNGWWLSDVWVTVEAFDTLSGLFGHDYLNWFFYYQIDSGPITYFETGRSDPFPKFLISGEGCHTFTVWIWDRAGTEGFPSDGTPPTANEWHGSIDIWIDMTAPETTIDLDGEQGLNNWYTSDVFGFFSADDDLSDVMQILYSFDGINWLVYYKETYATTLTIIVSPTRVVENGFFTISGELKDELGEPLCNKLLQFYIQHNGGSGWSEWSSLGKCITDGISGQYGLKLRADWDFYDNDYLVNFRVEYAGEPHYSPSFAMGSMEVEDGGLLAPLVINGFDTYGTLSSPSYFLYDTPIIDGDPPLIELPDPILLSDDGTHTIYYYSIDMAGNVEQYKSIGVKIDKTPPETELDYVQIPSMGSEVTLISSDSTSGVAITMYSLDGLLWIDYTTPFILSSGGIVEVYYCSIDLAGNSEIEKTDLVLVNIAPEADAGGPYVSNEGTSITFDASASSDIEGDQLQFRWDFDNDGVWDTEWSTNPSATHTWDDDYSGLVTVEVSDGQFSDTDTTTVDVNNIAPSFDAGADQTVDEGEIVTFSSTFIDPGSDTFTYSWDFGDGTPAVTGTATEPSTLLTSYAYEYPGVYTVMLTITDDDGGVGTDSFVVTVEDITPPTTTLNFLGLYHVDDHIYISSTATQIELSAEDAEVPHGSGVDYIEYQIDSTGWFTYDVPFTVDMIGTHIIYYRSIDNEVNVEEYQSVEVVVNASELIYLDEPIEVLRSTHVDVYSDPAFLHARLIDIATQLPIPGKTIHFAVGSQTGYTTTDSDGYAILEIVLDQEAETYPVVAWFDKDEEYLAAQSEILDFAIEKETAHVDYTGSTVVPTTASAIYLRATVLDDDDGTWGDLTKIYVTFKIYTMPLGGLTLYRTYGPFQIETTVIAGVGVFEIEVPNLPEECYTIRVSLDLEDNAYYQSVPSEDVIITVYEPTGDFATGGGWVYDSDGNRGNFGFNVKYKKNGLPKGQFVYIYRTGEYKFRIKATAWLGMAIIENNAFFEAKCVVEQYDAETDELIWSEGNYLVRVDVWDNEDNEGLEDVFHIRVYDKQGLVYYESGFDPYGFLQGGSIIIHTEKEE